MKAIQVESPGGPEVLRLVELADPVPGPHEVVVQVHAAALNRADLLQRRGLYPPPKGATEILGLECAGSVLALGPEARRFALGSRVMALLAGGGYAERVLVHEDMLLAVPERLSFVQAAAVPEAFLTASEALLTEGELRAGECVLVTAAASGVGSAALQIAKWRGAQVLASASAEKLDFVTRLGAAVALERSRDDFVTALLAATAGEGVDVLLDLVGGAALERHQACLARRGRHVVVGLLGGSSGKLDLGRLLLNRQKMLGLVMRSRRLEEKIAIVRRFEEQLLPALVAGALEPQVSRVFPFAEVAEAHRHMERNENLGKIVLEWALPSAR